MNRECVQMRTMTRLNRSGDAGLMKKDSTRHGTTRMVGPIRSEPRGPAPA